MHSSLGELLGAQATRHPDQPALIRGDASLSYAQLWSRCQAFAGHLRQRLSSDHDTASTRGPNGGDHVAIWLPKTFETVIAALACTLDDSVFVLINPQLKAAQVGHILRDSGCRLLISQQQRADMLKDELPEDCATLLIDAADWPDLADSDVAKPAAIRPKHKGQLAALFYTSGSTGKPKGVMISHANLIAGAQSVAEYLDYRRDDVLLAVLPLSFDYGFNQISSALVAGASVVLMDYLLPQEIPRAIARYDVSGLAGVPTLWQALARTKWPQQSRRLRFITNSGGRFPPSLSAHYRQLLPETQIILMYGLTEAFRASYLPATLIDQHPDSMGSAVPCAQLAVIDLNGQLCPDDTPGELVQAGELVALGYWNQPQASAERFRPCPAALGGATRRCVFSGDTVRRDANGLLYFIERRGDQLKSAGYRISPDEIEDATLAFDSVISCAAVGLDDDMLGQRIVLVATPTALDKERLAQHLKQTLPNFMQPAEIVSQESLPHNPNGKIDRAALRAALQASLKPAPTGSPD